MNLFDRLPLEDILVNKYPVSVGRYEVFAREAM